MLNAAVPVDFLTQPLGQTRGTLASSRCECSRRVFVQHPLWVGPSSWQQSSQKSTTQLVRSDAFSSLHNKRVPVRDISASFRQDVPPSAQFYLKWNRHESEYEGGLLLSSCSPWPSSRLRGSEPSNSAAEETHVLNAVCVCVSDTCDKKKEHFSSLFLSSTRTHACTHARTRTFPF